MSSSEWLSPESVSPKGVPVDYSLLQEALQDQQVGWLKLFWNHCLCTGTQSMCDLAHLLSELESLFPTALWPSHTQVLLPFKVRPLRRSFSWCWTPSLGSPMGGLDPSLLGEHLYCCYSVVKLCPALLWPHELQHPRLPCPSLSPGVYSDSCPLSQWCHPTISSSVIPFSSCLQSVPASGSFPMNQLFASHDQNIGASASASVLALNIQSWFLFGLTGLISLLPKGLSRVSSSTLAAVIMFLFLCHPPRVWVLTISHPCSFYPSHCDSFFVSLAVENLFC